MAKKEGIYGVLKMNPTRTIKSALHNLGRQSYTAYHDYFSVYRKYVAEHSAISNDSLSEASVLDFGCGYHYPNLTLIDLRVRNARGLDIIDQFYSDSFREQFGEKPVNSTFDYFSSKIYYRYLEWFANENPAPEHLRPNTYDGRTFPYEDNAFTILYSNGAFHLVPNYEEIIEEMSRVVSKDGYVNLNFRNESSLYGYNTPNCTHSAFEDGAPRPWAHLRDYDPNELGLFGPDDYERIFDTFRSEFKSVHVYLSDRSNHVVPYDAEIRLPTENEDMFIWEDDEAVTDDVRTETGVESSEFLQGRSIKLVAKN